ncbi:MAG: RidA family protein [Devosia sp.]
MTNTVEDRLAEMGLSLPAASAPAGSYVPVVQTGSLLFVSGQLPMGAGGLEHVGRCGENVSMEMAQDAARLCALNILAQVKVVVGDLEKINRIVKVNGFVNSTPDFGDHPKVINGASDLFAAALGDKGKHARAAVGVANLPFGAAVEVEAVVEIAGA